MPYYSNKEIKSAPAGYQPAKTLPNGYVQGPRCCGRPMNADGGCAAGCCDDYRCASCGHTVRVEWPD